LPNSNDEVIIALRSVEEDCTEHEGMVCKQRMYASIFNLLTGEVLLAEELLSNEFKFEGVEVVKLV